MKDLGHIMAGLDAIAGLRVLAGEPMARHTSLRVGGPADWFVRADDDRAVATLLSLVAREGIPCMVLGNGTNLLVTDEGIEGVVLALDGDFRTVNVRDGSQDVLVNVGAAMPLPALLTLMAERDCAGLDGLTGIPGSVGGAVRMNAGTADGSVAGVLQRARLAILGDVAWVEATSLNLQYRHSDLPAGAVIVGAEMTLRRGRTAKDREVSERIASHRRQNQPPMRGTAGSFFRNPDAAAGLFAGRMIEEAGLKGYRRGGAEVSKRHANFLFNPGNAAAKDLLELAIEVQSKVCVRTGIRLMPEVCIVGRGSDQWRVRLGAA